MNSKPRPDGLVKAFAVAALVASGAAIGQSLDLSDPIDAMETWVRLKGDTAGRVTYEWVTGFAYGVPVGAPSQPLFQIESVTVRQNRRDGESAYLERTFACRLYRDADTGDYMDAFTNPFTGKRVALKPSCSPGPPLRLSAAGMELLSDMTFESTALGRHMTLQRIDAGDHVIIRRDAHSRYVVPSSGEVRREMSIDTFKLKPDDLNDTRLTALLPAYSWVSNTQWMSLFDMADTPGHMIWSINGRKFMTAEALPAEFRAALERYVPGALDRDIEWPD